MPMRRVPIRSIIWSSCFALAACGATDSRAVDPSAEAPATGAAAVSPDLTAHAWQLSAFAARHGAIADLPEPLMLRFDRTQLRGNAPCNGFSATYERVGDAIAVGAIMATKRACGALPLESEYLQALAGARTATLREGRLILTGKDAELTFEATALAPP